MAKAKTTGNEQVVEEKLRNLYELQKVYSTIDKIRIVRGELPLEVTDLEDEVAGLETRITNLTDEVSVLKDSVVEKNNAIKDAKAAIKNTKRNKVKFVTTVSTTPLQKKWNTKI